MKIVSALDMAEIDRRSGEEYGLSAPVLMENAGIRLWDEFKKHHGSGGEPGDPHRRRLLVFLAGRGNNGGDACVMARQAWIEGWTNQVVIHAGGSGGSAGGSGVSGDPASCQKSICRNLGIPLYSWEDDREICAGAIRRGDFLFDGLCGTGIRGALRPPLPEIMAAANASDARRIALDLPSGLGDSWRRDFPVFRAHSTYTIGLPLTCLYLPQARTYAGDITVVPIGFPRELTEDPKIPGELAFWEARRETIAPVPRSAYKKTRGSCAVFAGSQGTPGAGLLCSQAAARSRAGLVSLFLPGEFAAASAAAAPGIIARPWSPLDSPGGEDFSLEGYSAILAGPGWGLDHPARRKAWLARFFESGLPGVLDADGLRLFAEMEAPGRVSGSQDAPSSGPLPGVPAGTAVPGGAAVPGVPPGRWVFTPHPGEFAGLTGLDVPEILADPLPPVLDYADRTGAVVVLKANVTWIGAPGGNYWVVDGENPALGCGGSGDVLAGVIAGFLAAGMDPRDAAVTGVCLHQELGKRVFRRRGWFMAQDLLPEISGILGRLD